MMEENKRVLLGMSGGTDSSVAAMRLLEAGYEVTGVTFRFYDTPGGKKHEEDARNLADVLGIPHFVHDAREEFRREVVEYFVREYLSGRTPVPCAVCNNRMKWPLLRKIADEKGIFHLSTGHYVRKTEINGTYYISPAVDSDKDQSFFLWGLRQEVLRRMLLPMGDITKGEARAWAARCGFEKVSVKKDSLGICFCPSDYRLFIRQWMETHPESTVGKGKFVDEEGRFIALHEGFPYYTVGQRRGLGIQLNRPVFVKEIRPETNEIVLSAYRSLEKTEMWLAEWNIVDAERLLDVPDVVVRIRYRKQENHCTVSLAPDGLLHVRIREPLAAVAPGQAAAFYKDGLLLGGGIIAASV